MKRTTLLPYQLRDLIIGLIALALAFVMGAVLSLPAV